MLAGSKSLPPSESLQPADSVPAPEAVVDTNDDEMSASGVTNAVDPCPEPSSVISSSPDDLAKVQEEIDRFTLCVQRAQLLERFNESVSKDQESVDQALGLKNNALEPLNDGALAGADVTPVDAPAQDGAPSVSSFSDPSANVWSISDIYGASSDMQAKLLSPAGDEVRVRVGTVLPDEQGSVVRITSTDVVLKVGSKEEKLVWSTVQKEVE
jgi:type IV pilus biogenesis protein PilP